MARSAVKSTPCHERRLRRLPAQRRARGAARGRAGARREGDRAVRGRGRRAGPLSRPRRARRWSRPGSTRSRSPRSTAARAPTSWRACIVIEEVARVCATSSLDPRGQRARAHPDPAVGLRRAEAPGPAVDRRRRGDDQLRAVRARGGLRRRVDADPRPPRRRRAGCSTAPSAGSPTRGSPRWYTVMAVTDPEQGGQRHLGVRRARRRPGLRGRPEGAQARHRRLADPGDLLPGLPDPRRPDHRRGGHRVQDRARDARPHPSDDRGAGRRHRAGRARRGARATSRSASSSASTSPSSRACSSCSPTWR